MNGNSSRWLIERRYGFGVGGVTLAAAPRAKAPRPAPAVPGASAGVLAGFLLFSAGVISLHRQSPERTSDLEVAWLAPEEEPIRELEPQVEPPPIPEGGPVPRTAETPEPADVPSNEAAPLPEPQPGPPPASPRVEIARVTPPQVTQQRKAAAPRRALPKLPTRPELTTERPEIRRTPPQKPPAIRSEAPEKRPPRNLGAFPGKHVRGPAEASPTPSRARREVASTERAPAIPTHIALPTARPAGPQPTELAAASPLRSPRGSTDRKRSAGQPRQLPASVSLPGSLGTEDVRSPEPVPSPRRGRPKPEVAKGRTPELAIAAPTSPVARTRASEALPAAPVRSVRDRPRAERPRQESRFEAVSLASLASCRSDRDEDRLKMAVLAARSRQATCRSDAGAFHFVEARNLNAFLLSIERAPDRPLEDRCGELAHVLKCLKQATNKGTVQ